MLGKLFTTADGKIPFLQIAIGILLGAVAMFLYAKFYKPKLLFQDSIALVPGRAEVGVPKAPSVVAPHQTQQTVSPLPMEATTLAQPSFLDLNDVTAGGQIQMPKLGNYKQEEYTNEDTDDEEDDEDDEHMERVHRPL